MHRGSSQTSAASAAGMSSVLYGVKIINQQNVPLKALVFNPGTQVNGANPTPTAWLASAYRISNGTSASFTWPVTWGCSFSYGQTYEGVVFENQGNVEFDGDAGSTTFTVIDGNPQLSDPLSGGPKGQIAVSIPSYKDGGPPQNSFTIGVTMNGKVVGAYNASPGVNQTWSLHPKYQIGLGDYREGQMVSLGELTALPQLKFEAGQNYCTATFTKAGTWEISYSPTQNAMVE